MAHWVCPGCWARWAPGSQPPAWLRALIDMSASEEMRSRAIARREVSLEALLARARTSQETV